MQEHSTKDLRKHILSCCRTSQYPTKQGKTWLYKNVHALPCWDKAWQLQTDINRPPGSSISDLNMDPCQAEQFHSIFENRVDPDQQGKQAGRYTQYWTKYELFACLVIFHDFFLSSAEYYFKKKKTPKCQTAWIQIRSDVLLGLIWVQTVCKDHQQTIKFDASKERIN